MLRSPRGIIATVSTRTSHVLLTLFPLIGVVGLGKLGCRADFRTRKELASSIKKQAYCAGVHVRSMELL